MFSFATAAPPAANGYVPSSSTTRQHMDLDFDDDDLQQDALKYTVPGEEIADAKLWMRGHGTYLDTANNAVLAGVAGKVERVNKLVSVKPVRGRYKPEVGDLVVGRIVQVQARRWKVDVGARLDAVLMLSSINLPGGVQRRKLESDELQMRTFFSEGDLLVSEVQAFFQDGSISLHTRSLRYGKLRNGLLIRSPSSLISRLKSHFIVLPCGVQLIVGLNGFIWVCIAPKEAKEEDDDEEAFTLYSNKNDDLPMEKHEAIARVGKCIEILAESGVRITEARVASLWEASLEGESVWSVKDLAKGGAGRAELVQRLPIICEA